MSLITEWWMMMKTLDGLLMFLIAVNDSMSDSVNSILRVMTRKADVGTFPYWLTVAGKWGAYRTDPQSGIVLPVFIRRLDSSHSFSTVKGDKL
jgi:hypothetical protein